MPGPGVGIPMANRQIGRMAGGTCFQLDCYLPAFILDAGQFNRRGGHPFRIETRVDVSHKYSEWRSLSARSAEKFSGRWARPSERDSNSIATFRTEHAILNRKMDQNLKAKRRMLGYCAAHLGLFHRAAALIWEDFSG
jgi:hypothetical protein